MNCYIKDCTNKSHRKNLCNAHYLRFLRNGDPNITKRRQNGSGTILNGYKLIYHLGKQNYEHRIVMETILNRKLKRSEIVHHIDRNKLNNSESNLEILKQDIHCKIHHTTSFRNKTHKQCTKCKFIKPRWQFGKDTHKGKFSDKNRSWCKTCECLYTRNIRKKNQT